MNNPKACRPSSRFFSKRPSTTRRRRIRRGHHHILAAKFPTNLLESEIEYGRDGKCRKKRFVVGGSTLLALVCLYTRPLPADPAPLAVVWKLVLDVLSDAVRAGVYLLPRLS